MNRHDIATFLVLATVSLSAFAAPEAPRTTASAERFVDHLDVTALVNRVLAPEGFVDPVYIALINGPVPYYSDFFGVQALQDVSFEQLQKDFVPDHAQVGAVTDHSLQLVFPGGWTATVCTPCSLEIQGNLVPFSHVSIDGNTFREFVPHLREFLAVLHARRVESTYLIPNPLFHAELAAARRMTFDATHTPVTVDPDVRQFNAATHAVLIFPDPVHGDIDTYNRLVELLNSTNFDWFGLEMLPSRVQKQADIFVTAPENSPAYREARAVLIREVWKDRYDPNTSPENNHYFKLLELMRARKTRIIGLEGAPSDYSFFGRGEIEGIGAAARNLLWARRIPRGGRGIVFGGSAHFASEQPMNFQDYLADSDPRIRILSISPIGGGAASASLSEMLGACLVLSELRLRSDALQAGLNQLVECSLGPVSLAQSEGSAERNTRH